MGWFSEEGRRLFLATTTPPDVGTNQYLGVVNGEAIIGANIFVTCFRRCVTWSAVAGGYERSLAGARSAALEDMIAAAKELGATGIIGIDFDYEVFGETNGMMMVAVSGTAVKMAYEVTAKMAPGCVARYILGIDPGLRSTGFGLIEQSGSTLTYVASGCIKTDDSGTLPERLLTIAEDVQSIITQHA